MEEYISETQYPLYFRKEDAIKLGQDIKSRHSVILIGMKRVGISNFLRFFLYHQKIIETYVQDNEQTISHSSRNKKHLFIPVDLNDMVEREIFPFWILTFKRIVDNIEEQDIPFEIKQEIEDLFLESIQLNDQFLLIENIRKTLIKIVDLKFVPTIFFIRFDRMTHVITENLFANLRGLQDSLHSMFSYVITCYRPLDEIIPNLEKSFLATFTKPIYLCPASQAEQDVLLAMYQIRYNLHLSEAEKKQLFSLTGGHVRFLQLALILLHEQPHKNTQSLETLLLQDERIMLQAEELWESLTIDEQNTLRKLVQSKISPSEVNQSKYLIDTGFIVKNKNSVTVFSKLFEHFIQNKTNEKAMTESNTEFTKKELALFKFLQKNISQVCERDLIIKAVWTDEEEALEVSDWAMDRLVARVRAKLKKQSASYEIQTIRTRGYKLTQI